MQGKRCLMSVFYLGNGENNLWPFAINVVQYHFQTIPRNPFRLKSSSLMCPPVLMSLFLKYFAQSVQCHIWL
jgi:hypothetical protein